MSHSEPNKPKTNKKKTINRAQSKKMKLTNRENRSTEWEKQWHWPQEKESRLLFCLCAFIFPLVDFILKTYSFWVFIQKKKIKPLHTNNRKITLRMNECGENKEEKIISSYVQIRKCVKNLPKKMTTTNDTIKIDSSWLRLIWNIIKWCILLTSRILFLHNVLIVRQDTCPVKLNHTHTNYW